MINNINGTNGATGVPKIKGRGIANRRANKRQRAALVAAILAGDADFKPSMRQLAQLFGVSAPYVGIAQQLSAAKRKAIIAGEDAISFSALLNPPAAPFAFPKPKLVSDQQLEDIIRVAGIERTLNAAASVEARAV
jgi:hypothetical protein